MSDTLFPVAESKPAPECQHRYPRIELDGFEGGWAECRDCSKVADFCLEFEEWLDPDEYERRQAEDDELFGRLASKEGS